MTMPCQGATKPEAGVMVPRPATAPEIMPSTDGLRRTDHSIAAQTSAPAQAARGGAMIPITARAVAAQHRPAPEGAEGVAETPYPREGLGGERGSAVEAEPADPQQAGADHGQR